MAQVKGDPLPRPQSPACDPQSCVGRICVCKLCNCGMHKCPTKHTSVHAHYDPNTKSEYVAKYPEWPMPKKFVRKHPPHGDAGLRLDCNTTYTDDFIKWPHGPRASCRPVPRTDNTGPFKDETTYKVDYWDKSKNMQPRQKMEHQTHHGGGPFSGETTYKVDFANRGPQPKNVVVKHGCSLGQTGAKFDGDTTYHDDFKTWKLPKKYMHVKRDGPGTSGPFQGPTTYQSDYQGQPIPHRCPTLSRPKPTIICGDHMCY